MPTVVEIQSLIKNIITLSNDLPLSVPSGVKEDKIWTVMNAAQGDTAHEMFNKRFDAMFGEDCRNSAGRLQYVRKGKLGLGLICSYLSSIDWADDFPLDIVEIKLQRLLAELKQLQYVTICLLQLASLPNVFLVNRVATVNPRPIQQHKHDQYVVLLQQRS
jgi:hypothetical protein